MTTKLRVVPTTSGSSSEDNDALGLISDMLHDKNWTRINTVSEIPEARMLSMGPGGGKLRLLRIGITASNRRILEVKTAFNAVVNVIFAYGDEALARRVTQIERRRVVRKLKDLAKWVESEVQTFHLCPLWSRGVRVRCNWFMEIVVVS